MQCWYLKHLRRLHKIYTLNPVDSLLTETIEPFLFYFNNAALFTIYIFYKYFDKKCFISDYLICCWNNWYITQLLKSLTSSATLKT